MALTDIAIRNAMPRAKPCKISDAGGLNLLVTPAGGKSWRWKFRATGKEKLLSFGGWPEGSLSNARKERDKARHWLRAVILCEKSNRQSTELKCRLQTPLARSLKSLSTSAGGKGRAWVSSAIHVQRFRQGRASSIRNFEA